MKDLSVVRDAIIRSRGLGNTTELIKCDKAIIVTHSESFALHIEQVMGNRNTRAMSLTRLERRQFGLTNPLVFDNAAILELCEEALTYYDTAMKRVRKLEEQIIESGGRPRP